MRVATASRVDRAASLRLLRTLIASLSRSARAIESKTGVTNAQLFLLRQLATTEMLSVNELADRVHARQNAVSSVLRHLVGAGLVQRSRSTADGRRAVLSLTPAGRRLSRRAPRPPAEVLLHALKSLPARDARKLVVGLRALIAAMGLKVAQAPLLFEERSGHRASRGAH